MSKKSLFRAAAVATVVSLLMAAIAPLSAFAATEPPWDATTNGNVYLVDGTSYANVAAGTQLDWDTAAGVVLSSVPAPADLVDYKWATFPAPTGASVDYFPFLSPVGSERTPSTWKMWGDPSTLDGLGAWLPSVWPGHFLYGTPAAVKAAGGTYSLGIAYTDSPIQASTHVVKAYYVTVNVDAGTGTWTFSQPPSVVSTATALSADKTSLTVGGSVKLTATVTPSAAAGTVEFFDGTTSLGTSVVSTGTATKTTTVASVGSHSYKATYTPSTSVYGGSTSSAVGVTSVAKKFTTANKPTISGTAKVGKKLTAKVKAWNPVAKFTYQWYANGTAIQGATKSTWKLAKAQKGKKITVKVTGSRADYARVSLTSKATAKVKK